MKTKTKFDSTSDARNLINSVIEKFPKGPERDGLQTKLREFYNCFVGAMRLPQGYDRSKVIEEGTQNLHAAQRIADRIDKQNGNAKFSTMISILASNLTDLKRDHSKTGKIEDNFYGKRIVKGIFAKVRFSMSVSYDPATELLTVGNKHYKCSRSQSGYVLNVLRNVRNAKNPSNEQARAIDEFQREGIISITDKTFNSKARFDKSNYYALEGTVDGNATGSKTVETIEEAMYYGKAMLAHMKKQSPKAKVATVHIFKVVNYQRENTPVKVLNSRTGFKAKFSHLSTMLDMLDYQSANDQEDLARKNIKGLAQSIGKLNPTKDEWSRYVKIAKSLGFSESQISGFARTGSKAKFASHPSWSEGILGKETDPKLAAYSWISKNNIESGRRQMLLADLAAGMYENNKSLSIAQAVLAAAKDMVRKGVATTEIQQWAGNGGKFSRIGAKVFK